MPFVAHWVALLNPDTGQYVPLVIDGLDERSRRPLEGSTVISDLELAGLPRMRRPVCLWDAPVPLQGMPNMGVLAGRILGGPGPRVDHPDGRYLVLLGLHTDTPAHPNEQARDMIGLLAPTIAVALEPDARAEDDFRGRCSHSH